MQAAATRCSSEQCGVQKAHIMADHQDEVRVLDADMHIVAVADCCRAHVALMPCSPTMRKCNRNKRSLT